MDRAKREQLKEYLHLAKALLESMNTSITADSPNNIWKYSTYKEYVRKYNQLVTVLCSIIPVNDLIEIYDIDSIPDLQDTVPMQQKQYFESVHANLSILQAYVESKLDLKVDEIVSLKDFLQINLRKVIFALPEKEIAIQDGIEQLLVGRGLTKGLDYDREVGRVKVSIKEVKPDFIFPRLGLALEVKFSKDKYKSKEIVDEINADITAYRKAYPFILFVVYDLGTIRDDTEFKNDLEGSDGVSVIIVKH